jgi:hypothetical protein
LEEFRDPFLDIQVFNRFDEPIEQKHVVLDPVAISSKFVFWGCMWHMCTPLENIEAGSYIFFEFKDKQMALMSGFPKGSISATTTGTSTTGTSSSAKSGMASSSAESPVYQASLAFPLLLDSINSGPQTAYVYFANADEYMNEKVYIDSLAAATGCFELTSHKNRESSYLSIDVCIHSLENNVLL